MNDIIWRLKGKLMQIRKNYFSFEGRISRRTYILRLTRFLMVMQAVIIVLGAYSGFFIQDNFTINIIAVVLTIIFVCVETPCYISLNFKRMHDFNESGFKQWPFILMKMIFEFSAIYDITSPNHDNKIVDNTVALLFFIFCGFIIFLASKKGKAIDNIYGTVNSVE